jgi:hypothetical protein
MKHVGIVLIMVMMLGLWQAATPRGAYACSCAQPPEPRDALEKSSTVFSGLVLSSTVEDTTDGNPRRAITFDVISAWKGISSKQVVVRTGMDSAGCGFDFEVGKRYLVYTYDNAGSAYTGLCDRTKLLTVSGEDIAKLGPGKPPVPKPTGQPAAGPTPQPAVVQGEQASFIPYVIPIAAVAVIVLVVYMVMFRGKKV